MVGERFGALRALLRGHDIDHLKALLEQDALPDRVLDRDAHADPARVRLRPDKRSVNDAHLVQARQPLETECQQLARLGRGRDPRCWREEEAVAVAAKVDRRLARDALRAVVRELDAVGAESAGGKRAVDSGAASAAEDPVRVGQLSCKLSREDGGKCIRGCVGLRLCHAYGDGLVQVHRHGGQTERCPSGGGGYVVGSKLGPLLSLSACRSP